MLEIFDKLPLDPIEQFYIGRQAERPIFQNPDRVHPGKYIDYKGVDTMSPRKLLLKLIAEAEVEYHAYYSRKVKLAEQAPTTEAVNVVIESIQPKHEFFVDYLLNNGVQVREKAKRERAKYFKCPRCGAVHDDVFYTCSKCGW